MQYIRFGLKFLSVDRVVSSQCRLDPCEAFQPALDVLILCGIDLAGGRKHSQLVCSNISGQ